MAQSSISPHKRLFALLELERNDLWVAIVFSPAIGSLTLFWFSRYWWFGPADDEERRLGMFV